MLNSAELFHPSPEIGAASSEGGYGLDQDYHRRQGSTTGYEQQTDADGPVVLGRIIGHAHGCHPSLAEAFRPAETSVEVLCASHLP